MTALSDGALALRQRRDGLAARDVPVALRAADDRAERLQTLLQVVPVAALGGGACEAAQLVDVDEERRAHAGSELRRRVAERGGVAEAAVRRERLVERPAPARDHELVAGRSHEEVLLAARALDREPGIDARGVQGRDVAAPPRERLERAHRALRRRRVLRRDHERGARVARRRAGDEHARVAHPPEQVAADVEAEALLRLAEQRLQADAGQAAARADAVDEAVDGLSELADPEAEPRIAGQ